MSSVAQPDNAGLLETAQELIDSLDVAIVLLHGVQPNGQCTCPKAGCPSAGKHPRDAGWQQQATKVLNVIEDWVRQHHHLNIGWIPGNHYLVVDVDPRNGGVDSYQRMRHLFPTTRTHITGGDPVNGVRGRHAIYRRPEGVRFNQTGRIAQGIDYKTGNGSLLVAPGSRTAGPYLVSHAETGIVELPHELVVTINGGQIRGAKPSPKDRFGESVPRGRREDELIAYAGSLAGRVSNDRLGAAEAQALMEAAWQNAESYPDGDNIGLEKALSMLDRMLAKDAIRDISPQEPVDDPVLADGYWGNDIGNSQRLLDHTRGQAKWVDSWGTWVVYRGGVWRIDANRVLMLELARDTIVEMRQAAAMLPKQPRESLWKWANASSSVRNLEAMVKMARGAEEVYIDHYHLNTHPHLLNVANGTIDLQTNDILPHAPNHLLTTQAPVDYDPEAECNWWRACVARWQPDQEVRWFLQKAVGSGLIGYAVQHLFINWGGGGNGKGVFYNTIGEILGDDYYTIPHQSLITVQKHSQHDTVKASLYGARMAVAAETTEGAELNEAQVKELTGGDILRARRMRENEWNFRPTHTMFLHTNHKPRVRGNDEGIWRRIFLIPWTVTIPEDERDDQFKDVLLEERSGILNWLLEGCAGFLREGFKNPPASILAATEEYRHDSDLIGRCFMDIGLVADPDGWEATADIQRRWQQWCEQQGIRMPPVFKHVTGRIERMGGVKYRARLEGKQPNGYKGVRLNTEHMI